MKKPSAMTLSLVLLSLGLISCKNGVSYLSDDDSSPAQDSASQREEENDDELNALLADPKADEILNYDHSDEIEASSGGLQFPDIATQRRSGYSPDSYLGNDAYEFLRKYSRELESNKEFAEFHQMVIEYGEAGLGLEMAEQEAQANAQSITTNLPFGKGSEYWLKEVEKARSEYAKLRDQYAESGLTDFVIIGFSGFSDDLRQAVAGGTGFEAAVAAARAKGVQWNDGLQSLGAGPVEYVLGTGIIGNATRSLGRMTARAATLRASANFARNFIRSDLRQAMTQTARRTKTLISQLLRNCTGLNLSAGGVCENAVKIAGQAHIQGGWIKRALFSELNLVAGPQQFRAFKDALTRGLVPPTGHAGIKWIQGPLYELKINGSAMRLLGLKNKDGIVVFTRFERNGLHSSNAREIIESMLRQAG